MIETRIEKKGNAYKYYANSQLLRTSKNLYIGAVVLITKHKITGETRIKPLTFSTSQTRLNTECNNAELKYFGYYNFLIKLPLLLTLCILKSEVITNAKKHTSNTYISKRD